MTPKISVVVPVYGVEEYIERCARSLFEQTLTDIEYIFIDDCTEDNSITVLRQVLYQYKERISQTRIVKMPVNSGQAAVRKYGISLAYGEYIIHCDSDDWVEPNMYEKLYGVAKRDNSDIVICDYFKSKSEHENYWVHQKITNNKNELIRALLNENVHGSLWNKLIKLSLFKNIIYPKDNLREDLTIIFQITFFADKISYISEPYYHYFYNSESITNNSESINKSISKIEQSINNYMVMELFMKENEIYECFQKEVLNMKCRLKISALIYILSKGGYKKWNSVFPRITFIKVITSDLRILSKIEYIIAKLGLYTMYKGIKDFLR
ncbi:MAG: glycosyltransferase family 2 protein [Bacteroidales bacterium]|nr:glycosyltransferase family 2 protein [Bacteroidales bacterium]